jgi:hypothetical protein
VQARQTKSKARISNYEGMVRADEEAREVRHQHGRAGQEWDATDAALMSAQTIDILLLPSIVYRGLSSSDSALALTPHISSGYLKSHRCVICVVMQASRSGPANIYIPPGPPLSTKVNGLSTRSPLEG